MKNSKFWIKIAGIYGVFGVATGAFGAHALKGKLPPELFTVFETGSRYCLVHAVALLAVGILSAIQPSIQIDRSGWCFTLGIAIFSGTLWILAITGQRWLGAITPIGGGFLILGWFMLFWAGMTKDKQ
jgi:uncharacterized membrane protein YgdD (TMEM256/DUF423 family)